MLRLPFHLLFYFNLVLLAHEIEFRCIHINLVSLPDEEFLWIAIIGVVVFHPFRYSKLFLMTLWGYMFMDGVFDYIDFYESGALWHMKTLLFGEPVGWIYSYPITFYLIMFILSVMGLAGVLYGYGCYRDYFRWLLYWQLYRGMRASGSFSIGSNKYVFWGSYRRKQIINGFIFRLEYRIQRVTIRCSFLLYIGKSAVIKASNKLNIVKKYFFKNYILFRSKKKVFFKYKKKPTIPFVISQKFLMCKSIAFTCIVRSLLTNYFILAPKLLSADPQIYYFLLLYCSLVSVTPSINLFLLYYNLFFFAHVYNYLYNFLLKYRWLKKKNFLFMLNLFLLFFFKKAWFFLKFIKSIFWKKKKDNIKKIIYFVRSFFKKFHFFFFKIFQVSGLLFFFKGKIGSFGNSRKKILRLNFGLLNSTSFINNIIKSNCSFINKSGKTKCSLSLFF